MNFSGRIAATALALACGFAFSTAARADEALFGYVYGTETLPDGEMELQTTLTHRWDKGRGSFQANELQAELEYGITDKLSIAGYAMFLDIDHQGAFPSTAEDGEPLYPDRDGSYFRGAKVQLKYNILSPYLNNGWGLSVFIEPQYVRRFRVDGAKTRQLELEGGVIVQKNYLDDQLVLAFNSEVARERRVLLEDGNAVEHEWEFTNALGASYRVAPRWFVGLEGRHHMDVLQNPETGEYAKNQYSFFMGPTLHYASKGWWVTATYLRQLQGNPPYARSVGPVVGGVDDNLHLDENEKNEFRVKIGIDF
jgi:hypothetical protein